MKGNQTPADTENKCFIQTMQEPIYWGKKTGARGCKSGQSDLDMYRSWKSRNTVSRALSEENKKNRETLTADVMEIIIFICQIYTKWTELEPKLELKWRRQHRMDGSCLQECIQSTRIIKGEKWKVYRRWNEFADWPTDISRVSLTLHPVLGRGMRRAKEVTSWLQDRSQQGTNSKQPLLPKVLMQR